MRDTIIISSILLAIFASYHFFYDKHNQTQPVFKTTNGQTTSQTSLQTPGTKIHGASGKGVQHARTVLKRNSEAEAAGSGEGVAGQIEELSSIYPQHRETAPALARVSALGKTPDKISKKNLNKIDRVAGVPVQAFIDDEKNKLRIPAVSEPAPSGMRVFLWCMEVKDKTLEYTGKSDCDTIYDRISKKPIRGSGGMRLGSDGL